MLIKNYESVQRSLEKFLLPYLQEKGIDASNGKKFRCLNPNHADKEPSASIMPDGTGWKCFSCSTVGGIFDAAHYLDDKPKTGPGYITDNMLWLAKKYGVEVEANEPTEEEIYTLEVYRAYAEAARIIVASEYNEAVTKEIVETRKWTLDFCKQQHIGTVTSFEDFRSKLKVKFSAAFVDEIDLGRKDLFNEGNLIFTIKDEDGRPIGFSARKVGWEKGDSGSKYVNSKTTGVRVNIYQKSRRLYGLHHYLKNRRDITEPLYVFEGNPDWAAAVNAGLYRCAAIGGTAFTSNHVEELFRLSVPNIILALDGDKAGKDKTADLLDNKLSGVMGLNVSVVSLPDDYDPDKFIREKGIEEFLKLEKVDAFTWRLNQYGDEIDPIVICGTMIPLIVAESNFVKRELMETALAKHTGITLKAVQLEVERHSNLQAQQKIEEKHQVVEELTQKLKRNPDDAELLINRAQSQLVEVSRKYDEDTLSIDNFVGEVEIIKSKEEEKAAAPDGWKLGNLSALEPDLNGDWKEDTMIIFGGKENHGKSAYMSQLALQIAQSNEESLVIVHTIDDTTKQFLTRLVTQLAIDEATKYGVNVTMNKIKNPNYWVQNVNHNGEHDHLKEIREKAYLKLLRLVKEGRFIIKDAEKGSTLSYGEMLIRYYKLKFPDKKIVYFLDNFSKASDFRGITDERIRFKHLSNILKNEMVNRHHVCAIATAEYRKIPPGVKPANTDIAETVSISYDANAIIHMYSELSDLASAGREHSALYYYVDDEGARKPIVEMNFAKNKITDFRGTRWWKFIPEQSRYEWISYDRVKELVAENKGRSPEVMDGTGLWKNGERVESDIEHA